MDLMDPKFYGKYLRCKCFVWLVLTLVIVAWTNFSLEITNERCPQGWENNIPYMAMYKSDFCMRSDTILPVVIYFCLGFIFIITFTIFEIINLRNRININKFDKYSFILIILYFYIVYTWLFEGGFKNDFTYGIIHKGQYFVPLIYAMVIPISGLLVLTYITENESIDLNSEG